MGVEGLALALSISAVLEVIGLVWALHRRIDSVQEGDVLRSGARSAVAAVAAALLMLGGLTLVRDVIPEALQGGVSRLLVVAILTGAGGVIYVLVASALRAPEIGLLRSMLARRRGRAPRT
jgi:peptidoglycan biosynthesis protein MviN/MurJ (putative lipid II flippase)